MIASTPISLFQQTATEFGVILVGVTVVTQSSLAYLRRVRMERPPVGTFNGRDIAILVTFIVCLPFLYGYLPFWLITCLLTLTFSSALYLGYSGVLGRGRVWLLIGALIGLNIWTSAHLMGTTLGWQTWWLELDVLVILGAVAVANLYVQGGMKLKHVAWLALALAIYDFIFDQLLPLTDKLVAGYLSHPMDPLFGFRFGIDNYGVGLGDLLVYSLFLTACYKAYGWRAAKIAIGLIYTVGAFATAFVPFLIALTDPEQDLLVPAQVLFGPLAFATYYWMRRRWGPERTMAQFLASPDNLAGQPVTQPTRAAREPVAV
jgi:hypothetical protein